MHVDLVAPDRKVWSGDATMVIARTTEGDMGVLPSHTPTLSVLSEGALEIRPVDGRPFHVAVYGGFISINDNQVTLLAEHAELGEDIQVDEAEAALRAAEAGNDEAMIARNRARLQAASGRVRHS